MFCTRPDMRCISSRHSNANDDDDCCWRLVYNVISTMRNMANGTEPKPRHSTTGWWTEYERKRDRHRWRTQAYNWSGWISSSRHKTTRDSFQRKKMKKKNEREKMRRQRHEMIIFIVENCQVPALLLPWRRWRWNEGSVATQRQPLTNAFVTSVLCNPANSFATIFFSSLSSILSFGYVQDFRENDSISEKCFGEWVLCA